MKPILSDVRSPWESVFKFLALRERVPESILPDARLTVQVADLTQPSELYSRRTFSYESGITQGAVAGQVTLFEIMNPALTPTGGVNLVVAEVYVAYAIGTLGNVGWGDGVGNFSAGVASIVAGNRDTRQPLVGGQAVPRCLCGAGNQVAIPYTTRFQLGANSIQYLPRPWILAPGKKFSIGTMAFNVGFSCWFAWTEREVTPAELL